MEKKVSIVLVIINIVLWIVLPVFFVCTRNTKYNVIHYEQVHISDKNYPMEEISMAVNEAQTIYYDAHINKNNKEYKKSEPYFESSSGKTLINADVFVNNCKGAIDSETGALKVSIVRIINDKDIVITDENEMKNYKNDNGYIVGWYQSSKSQLYYGFIIDISTGRTLISNKGSKTNEETLLESEQEEKILYPTKESLLKKN